MGWNRLARFARSVMFSHEEKEAGNEGETERYTETNAEGDDLQPGVKRRYR